ncbi:hypothetical protein [Bacillus haynesii]|uniref:hypothetical protein n=1 Tax=Bacillus haynesii TaxID=1925021 RepID=UPI0022821AE7|nr:hypothetical protein [Bacillus haynesii]MCY8098848.1 hypothetical protein [Bacillus haynesii]MCY8468331.1 hypothetical protein [Bacillus haynesii]
MLSTDMFLELHKIYIEIISGKKYKRKKLKVVVDSIMEQLCGYYLNSRPNSAWNIRASVIKIVSQTTTVEDKDVLNAFNSLLREYDEAFSKSYSDHSDNQHSFIINELKDLTIALIKHSIHRTDQNADSLRGILL